MVNIGIIKTLLAACALVAALAPATVQGWGDVGLGEIKCRGNKNNNWLYVSGSAQQCKNVVNELGKVDGISYFYCGTAVR